MASNKSILGHRRDGRPIYAIAGGAREEEAPAPNQEQQPVPQQIVVVDSPPPTGEQQSRDDQGRFTAQQQQQQQQPNPNDPFAGVPPEVIERIRAEERAKVHTRLEKVDEIAEQLKREREERERLQREQEEAAEREAQARKQAEREGIDPRFADHLREVEENFQAQIRQIQEERERERAIFERERELAELERYRADALAQHGDKIAPQFARFVKGTTREEIDQAVQDAIASTEEIFSEIQRAQAQQAQQAQAARQAAPGVMPTAPAMGPLEEQAAQRQLSAEDIRNMTPAEFAQYRPQLLAEASRRGLYG